MIRSGRRVCIRISGLGLIVVGRFCFVECLCFSGVMILLCCLVFLRGLLRLVCGSFGLRSMGRGTVGWGTVWVVCWFDIVGRMVV